MLQMFVNFLSLYMASLVKCAFIVVMGLSANATAAAQKQPNAINQQNLLVSIHPMALLIKSAWPELNVSSLVNANQSPHDFVLKPSDISRIKAVDAVVWLGADFEPYLKNVIRAMPQVDVSQVINKDDHSGHQDKHQDEHHDHGHDPHLWLSPDRIKPILGLVQQALSLTTPVEFLASFDAWLIKAQQQLGKRQQVGFVSFHGAYEEWIEAFNLNQLAVVTSNPEKPVGTRHIVEVREILASGKASCLFVEPQFQSRIVAKLHKGLDIKVINIDPMASTHAISDAGFLRFYEELLSNFTQCLSS